MTRIRFYVRILISLFISFFIVYFSPALLTSSPNIPSKKEIIQLASNFSLNNFIKTTKINKKNLQPTITPIIPTNIVLPTVNIPNITVTITKVPTITSTTQQLTPTPIAPLPEKEATPTYYPTPTIKPTIIATPSPTGSQNKVVNYSVLNGFVNNMPQIGCLNNTTSGCIVLSLYNSPLDKGIGWATFYGYGSKQYSSDDPGNDLVAEVIKNRKGISLSAAKSFIDETFMETQSNLTPQQAKETGKVMGYVATRSPADLWKIKYLFGIDDPKNPQARFIGRVMVIDCAAYKDWDPRLATQVYSYKGWMKLNWIVDLSRNAFIKIPTGLSGKQDSLVEGRPGVILIDEASLDSLIY